MSFGRLGVDVASRPDVLMEVVPRSLTRGRMAVAEDGIEVANTDFECVGAAAMGPRISDQIGNVFRAFLEAPEDHDRVGEQVAADLVQAQGRDKGTSRPRGRSTQVAGRFESHRLSPKGEGSASSQ